MLTNKISVITPSYNSAHYIEECINSVIAQGSIIDKHIIVDGGSNDGTVEIVSKYVKNYHHINFSSERDEGQADALNKGLQDVNTQFFGWLNADDRYLNDSLRYLSDYLVDSKSENIAIIYGDYRLIDEFGNLIGLRRQPSFKYFDCLYSYLTIHNGAALFNTMLTKQFDGFDKSLKFAMDYDLILKISKSYEVLHVNSFISDFRIHPFSKTSNLEEIRNQETIKLRKKYSRKSDIIIKIFNKLSLIKVAIRMLQEKILFERIFRFIK